MRLYAERAHVETVVLMPTAARRAAAEAEFGAVLARARALDAAAWDRLYQFAFPQVYRYVAAKVADRHDAEDLTEEVFAGALQSAGSLRAADEAAFLGWLFQIARYKIADRLRRQYRKPTEALAPTHEVADADPTPEEAALRADAQASVRAAVAALTPEQQDVILMKYVLDYDNAQAARVMGKSPGAVNQLQHRALAQLRRTLLKKGGERDG